MQLFTDVTDRLNPGTVLISARRTLTVTESRPFGDRWIVRFEGIGDRTEADLLRGVELEAEPVEMEGTLWVHELIGATVRDQSGTDLGTVGAVEANPASDLLVLEGGGLIPMHFVTAHDAAAGTIEVDIPEGLLDL